MIEYINRKRYKKKCICGEVNFPYNTKFQCIGNLLTYNGKPICYKTSQDAFDYFVRNDDGNGELKGKLISTIINKTNSISDKLFGDSYLEKYKRKDCNDVWIWNYDFFDANLEILNEILEKINSY